MLQIETGVIVTVGTQAGHEAVTAMAPVRAPEPTVLRVDDILVTEPTTIAPAATWATEQPDREATPALISRES
jgi:hypothetical protein